MQPLSSAILASALALAVAPGDAAAAPASVQFPSAPGQPGVAAVAFVGSGFIAERAWRVDFGTEPVLAPARLLRLPAAARQDAAAAPQPAARPVAFEYSDGYVTRRKIHYVASFATIPLFVTQYVLGDKLYEGTASSGERTAHGVVAGGIAGLFGLNTVTGVWNLYEARKDPSGRTRRLVHGVMMLGANAGFVATGMLAPDDDGGGDRVVHRRVALTSMAVATASYVMMLLWR